MLFVVQVVLTLTLQGTLITLLINKSNHKSMQQIDWLLTYV